MLIGSLFGNKSIERILFFLLVNGKCYAGKLARHFATPLTPLQLGLNKLEELGIVESYKEGKTRYFQFNANCPVLAELEAFLRRAYMLLPAPDKQLYYDPDIKQKVKRPSSISFHLSKEKEMNLIFRIWEKLGKIQTLAFSSNSQGQGNSGWNGTGKGRVQIRRENDHVIIFNETGSWTSKEGREFAFTNTFRWTLDQFQHLIMLEHLRFGEHKPVFLFQLAQVDEETLESVSSYVCKEDSYLGQVKCNDHFIRLNWRILGPKKNEEIDYLYT